MSAAPANLGAMVSEPVAEPPQPTRAEALRASPPLFQTRTLDRLTRVHPAVVPLIFGPAIAVFAIRAFYDMSVVETILGVVGGSGIWRLSVSWMHRDVLHFEP